MQQEQQIPPIEQNQQQPQIENQTNDTIFHVENIDSYQESVWSSSEDNQNDTNQEQFQMANEDEDDDNLFEEPDVKVNPETVKTKNEVLYTQKAKEIQKEIPLETQEERQNRYGVTIKGDEIMVKIGELVHIMPETLVIEGGKPEILEQDNGIDKCELAKQTVQIETNILKILQDVLDLDNLLFNENKEILGTVYDVFGNVTNPHYQVLVDKYVQNLIEQGELKQNDNIYVLQGMNKMILKQQIVELKNRKGCDASNQNDEEILQDNDRYFSDDEQEQVHKQKRKQKNRKKDIEALENENEGDSKEMDQENDEEEKIRQQIIKEAENQTDTENNQTENLDIENNNQEQVQSQGQTPQKQQNSQQKKPNNQQKRNEKQQDKGINQNEKKNKNKKILVYKMVNGNLQKVFMKPAQFQELMKDPNAKIESYKNFSDIPQPQQTNYKNQKNQNYPQQQNNFQKNNGQNQYQQQQQQQPQMQIPNFLQPNFAQQVQQQQPQQQAPTFNIMQQLQINPNNNNQQQQQQQQQFQQQQQPNLLQQLGQLPIPNSTQNQPLNQNTQNLQQQQQPQVQNLDYNELVRLATMNQQQIQQMAQQMADKNTQNN